MRRQPYFGFFASCCMPTEVVPLQDPPTRATSTLKEKSEGKFSIRHMQCKSSNQRSNIENKQSIYHTQDRKFILNRVQTKQTESPSKHQTSKIENSGRQKKSLAKTLSKNQIKNQFGFCSLKQEFKQNKVIEESQLYKTAKIFSANSYPTQRISKFQQFRLEESKFITVKQPSTGNQPITSLFSSDNYAVSINHIETDYVNQKFQESVVMIDFFHPHSEKEQELQAFLERRQY